MLKSFVDLNKNSLKKMQNASVAFGVLTRNLNWANHYLSVFLKHSGMSIIKGISMKYAENIVLLSKLKRSHNIK